MIIGLEIVFEGRLDVDLLVLATELLFDAEPLLACRFAIYAGGFRWDPVPRADRRVLVVTHVREEYERIRRAGLDASSNVQVALCVWRREDGDLLLVQMTHEVGDGVSIRSLTARLASIYSNLCVDSAYRPRPNLVARRDIGQILSQVPQRAYLRMLWDFVTFLAPRWFPRRTHTLSLPHESIGSWVHVIKHLAAPSLSILSAYAKPRAATINDIFLAAAYRALASQGGWNGRSGLRIFITVDLRRWYLPCADEVSICNLSSLEFPFLIRRLGTDFDQTLVNVSSLTQRRKRTWPGLGHALVSCVLMKWAAHGSRRDNAATGKGCTKASSITLSNEGALDGASLCFGTQLPASTCILPPFFALPSVHMCLSTYAGSVTLAAVTPQNGVTVVDGYLDALLEQLRIAIPGLDAHPAAGCRTSDQAPTDRTSAAFSASARRGHSQTGWREVGLSNSGFQDSLASYNLALHHGPESLLARIDSPPNIIDNVL
jgi:NRPS condensation-like uncharacterized protein